MINNHNRSRLANVIKNNRTGRYFCSSVGGLHTGELNQSYIYWTKQEAINKASELGNEDWEVVPVLVSTRLFQEVVK